MGWVFTSPAFSLEGVRKATLTFFYKFETEQYYDNFYVWASGDDGRHWTKLAAGSGQSQGWNGWAPEATVDMSKFAGKSGCASPSRCSRTTPSPTGESPSTTSA